MEQCSFSPGELIFQENILDDCCIYYLVKGQVQIIFESNSEQREDTIVKEIEQKDYFGEIEFLTGNKRYYTAKATDFCRLYRIHRDQFLNIVKHNNEDEEILQMYKEGIMLNSRYGCLNEMCFICANSNH